MLQRHPSKSWLVVFAILTGLFSTAAAQAATGLDDGNPPEPIAVLHFAAYDRWYDNVALIGSIAGSPDLAQGIEAMLNIATAYRGLDGLDKNRPWAAFIMPRGPGLTAYACLPVDRLDSLLEVIRPLTRNITQHNGIHVIRFNNGATIRAAQRGGWAVVAWDDETIAEAAADPTALIGELPKQYDLALRLNVARLPQVVRAIVLARLNQYLADDRRANETETHYQLRRQKNRLAAEAVRAGIDELDSLTVGLTVDKTTGRLAAELTLVAKPDTSLAQNWSQFNNRNNKKRLSPLAGFRLPDAALNAHLSFTPSQRTVDHLRLLIDAAAAEACSELDRPGPKAGLKAIQELATRTGRQISARLAADQPLDVAVSVALHPQLGATLASAVRLPSDEDAPWKASTRAEKIGEIDAKSWRAIIQDTDQDGLCILNDVTIQFGGKLGVRKKPLDFFICPTQWGPRLYVATGAGKSNLYLAFGDDATQYLEKAIKASRTVPAKPAAPLDCSIELTPLVQLAAASAKGPAKVHAGLMAKALEESAGENYVHLTAEPVERGLRLRVELDQGVVRVMGLAAALFAQDQPTTEPRLDVVPTK